MNDASISEAAGQSDLIPWCSSYLTNSFYDITGSVAEIPVNGVVRRSRELVHRRDDCVDRWRVARACRTVVDIHAEVDRCAGHCFKRLVDDEIETVELHVDLEHDVAEVLTFRTGELRSEQALARYTQERV